MTGEPHTSADGIPELAARYTVDELTAIAELAGAAVFPGTGDVRLGDEQRAEARRSLVQRGTILGDGNGGITIAAPERALFTCALGAAAVLEVRHGMRSALLHVTAPLTLEQSADEDGWQRLAAFPSAMLPRRLAALTHLAAGTPATGEPVALEPAQAGALADGDAAAVPAALGDDMRASACIRVIRRRGETISGGEIAWIDAGRRGLWQVTHRASGPALAPADGAAIMASVRALLD